MKTRFIWLSRSVSASLLTGLLFCLACLNSHAQVFLGASDSTGFRGQATAVSGFALGSSLTFVNSGALFVSGGAEEASSLGESVTGVFTTGVTHTSAIGQGTMTATEASVANINITSGGMFFAGSVITADFVMASATATCTATGPMVSAQVQVSGLVVDGQAIAVSGQASQVVFVNGNFVIVNEQIVSQTASGADITVNALHVMTSTGANLIFGSTSAGITCGTVPSQPPSCGDFVTGGGWITGTPSGHKANFGVAGGIKNDAFWGHLNYVDHGNGMHVKATAVTGYAVDSTDEDCRIIDYTVTIDGQPGTARVRVCDKGEPGRDDIFEIQLSNSYFAGGDLGGARPGGGNIQLHECH